MAKNDIQAKAAGEADDEDEDVEGKEDEETDDVLRKAVQKGDIAQR